MSKVNNRENPNFHAFLFNRETTPPRYNRDKDGLSKEQREKIEELKQRMDNPLDRELQEDMNDPFFQ